MKMAIIEVENQFKLMKKAGLADEKPRDKSYGHICCECPFSYECYKMECIWDYNKEYRGDKHGKNTNRVSRTKNR